MQLSRADISRLEVFLLVCGAVNANENLEMPLDFEIMNDSSFVRLDLHFLEGCKLPFFRAFHEELDLSGFTEVRRTSIQVLLSQSFLCPLTIVSALFQPSLVRQTCWKSSFDAISFGFLHTNESAST